MRQRKPLVPNDDEMYQREQSVHKYDEVIEQQLALWSQTAAILQQVVDPPQRRSISSVDFWSVSSSIFKFSLK